jgi:hypothetical protein
MISVPFHVYQWDPEAVAVPPVPRPVSAAPDNPRDPWLWRELYPDGPPSPPAAPLTLGALVCIACRGLAAWHDHWGSDECPSLVTPAPPGATLAGSDPVAPDGAVRPRRDAW